MCLESLLCGLSGFHECFVFCRALHIKAITPSPKTPASLGRRDFQVNFSMIGYEKWSGC